MSFEPPSTPTRDAVDIDMSIEFATKDDAVAMLLEKNVVDKKPHKVVRSTKDRYEIVCRVEGCKYRASVRRRKDNRFHVAGYHRHTCRGLFPTIRTVWVKTKAKGLLADDTAMKTSGLLNALRVDYAVNVPRWSAQKGVVKARASISKSEECYGKLVPFLTALREANPGTTTDVVVSDGHLLRAFLCLRACATAFEASLRLMCVDGCHLKTGCGGVLLVASAVDGNGNAFPVAIAVTEGESADSWSWFLTLLRGALRIGDGEGVTIISDREKGIERGVADVLPASHHAVCLFHVEKNVVSRF